MTPKEQAAMQQALEALENYGIDGTKSVGGIKCTAAITALREALDHSGEANEMVAELRIVHEMQSRDGNWNYNDYMRGMFNGLELALAICENREPEYRKAEQAEQEPVAYAAMINGEIAWDADYPFSNEPFTCFDNEQAVPLYATPVQQAEQKPLPLGTATQVLDEYFLAMSDLDSDTLIYAAPVRTKDLTEYEIHQLVKQVRFDGMTDRTFQFTRAVIAKFKEKNNVK